MKLEEVRRFFSAPKHEGPPVGGDGAIVGESSDEPALYGEVCAECGDYVDIRAAVAVALEAQMDDFDYSYGESGVSKRISKSRLKKFQLPGTFHGECGSKAREREQGRLDSGLEDAATLLLRWESMRRR